MNRVIATVTERIIERSKSQRAAYIARMKATMDNTPPRKRLSCGNIAHAVAACGDGDKKTLVSENAPNLGITTSYNDMLSAHQPYKDYPDRIKDAAAKHGATAQIAGGVPAMCDGVTQGQAGMELSLFSRDIVAMATAVGLSHNMFDGNLFLGICDKIVPGMMIGALDFGHLPACFIPSGPMASGIPNKEKAEQRQKFAAGEIDRSQMLAVESASYHSPGTCTFYGTANSNQLLMEFMGVHLPGSSFVSPGTPLRYALTDEAVARLLAITEKGACYRPLYEVVTEKSLVNAVVGLLATGGSTNHSLHLVAIARAAGIEMTWEDMDEISSVVPLLTRIYPNGQADINHFQQAGGMAFLFRELRSAGLLNEDVVNIMGEGLESYELQPTLTDAGGVEWKEKVTTSGDYTVLTSADKPFSNNGGLRLLQGNLGKAVIKVSAVATEHQIVEAPCRVFESQEALQAAFKEGALFQDMIAVVRFQGPAANGMPELHKMTPLLGIAQDKGFKVALVTDGRMSGASGKVPAAIHVSPEAVLGGLIGKVRDGDIMRLNAETGELSLLVDEAELASREQSTQPEQLHTLGRHLFAGLRERAEPAELGGGFFNEESRSSSAVGTPRTAPQPQTETQSSEATEA
ncbi:phosphogluconate dehydratase [Marinibactrum halimedae]|nr:phosphogluconate dehydratase [Marinibactrum halimedae]MCD9460946.1 phosphogluconate dehydratase [Marinibactrum halimedae]